MTADKPTMRARQGLPTVHNRAATVWDIGFPNVARLRINIAPAATGPDEDGLRSLKRANPEAPIVTRLRGTTAQRDGGA